MEIINARDLAYNRNVLEKKKRIALIGLEFNSEKDRPKYLSSGLNGVLARIAEKNNNIITFDIKRLSTLSKTEKARVLARMSQNISFCRKAKTRLGLRGTLKEGHSLISSLGGSSEQASKAISF